MLEHNPNISFMERIGPELVGGLYPPVFELLFFILNVSIAVAALMLLVGVGHSWRKLIARVLPERLTKILRASLSHIVGSDWTLTVLLKDPEDRFSTVRDLCATSFSTGMVIAEILGLGFLLLPIYIAPQLIQSHLPISTSFKSVLILEITTGAFVSLVWILCIIQMFRDGQNLGIRALSAAASLIVVVLALFYVAHLWHHMPAFSLFDFIRATHLHNGVSPLMPMVFLSIAGTALVACHFWRMAMLEDRPLRGLVVPAPAEDETASFRGVRSLQKQVVDFLEGSLKRVFSAWLVIILLITAFVYFGFGKVVGAFSIDGRRFDLLFIILAFAVYSGFSLVLLRFIFTWLALRQLLRRLYSHPSRYSYKNVQLAPRPSHLDQQKIHLFEARPGLSATEYALGCVRAIVRIAGEAKRTADEAKITSVANTPPPRSDLADDICGYTHTILEPTLETAEKDLGELWKQTDWSSTLAARKALYDTMAKLTGIVISLFEPAWRMSAHTPPLQMVLSSDDDKLTTDGKLRQQAELFVAARVCDFVRHVFPHLINMVGFAMPAVLAMMLAVSVYPFPAHDTLLWVGWTVLLVTIFISLYVFIGINRDPILSMFSGTDPGQFNWDSTFTMHLLLFAVIPVLTLLGAQYPHALAGTFSWIGSVFGGGGSS